MTDPRFSVSSSRTFHQLSNWTNGLEDRATAHLEYGGVLLLSNRNAALAPNFTSAIQNHPHFWMIFSAGVELLLKAVLARHGLLRISRREPRASTLASLDRDVQEAYRVAREPRVLSNDISIHDQLQRLGINSLRDMNTPTLGTLARSKGVDVLVRAGVVPPAQGDLMRQRIECLAFIRRNVEAHIFLQLDIGEIGNDLSHVISKFTYPLSIRYFIIYNRGDC